MKQQIKKTRLIKAGDPRVLLKGNPPLVDCRVIAEDYYQELINNEQIDKLVEKYEKGLKDIRNAMIVERESDIGFLKSIEINWLLVKEKIYLQFITDLKGLGEAK